MVFLQIGCSDPTISAIFLGLSLAISFTSVWPCVAVLVNQSRLFPLAYGVQLCSAYFGLLICLISASVYEIVNVKDMIGTLLLIYAGLAGLLAVILIVIDYKNGGLLLRSGKYTRNDTLKRQKIKTLMLIPDDDNGDESPFTISSMEQSIENYLPTSDR